MASFPLLTMIDHRNGRQPDGKALSARPDAEELEARARALAEAYWSEHVWLTGQVSDAEFRAVYEALMTTAPFEPDEPKRRVLMIEPIRVAVLPPPFLAHRWAKWRAAS